MIKPRVDLTGQMFGNWLVISQAEDRVEPSGIHKTAWLCECQCENKTKRILVGAQLKKGETKSCGCLTKQLLQKSLHKENEYQFCEDYIKGKSSNSDVWFLFDYNDWELIHQHCWRQDTQGYMIATINNKRVYMHTLLCPNYKIVDHINRNRTDNRRNNLREATPSQNIRNSSKRSDNTSGVTGVCYKRKQNKWYAWISINSHQKSLGEYTKFEDAVKARKEAEKEYYKEFMPQ